MKSCSPSSFSRCAMAAEIDGGEIAMRCEASAMELASAAATKYCRWRRVKRIYVKCAPAARTPHPNPSPSRGEGL